MHMMHVLHVYGNHSLPIHANPQYLFNMSNGRRNVVYMHLLSLHNFYNCLNSVLVINLSYTCSNDEAGVDISIINE